MALEFFRNWQKQHQPDWLEKQAATAPVAPLLPGPTVLVIDDDAGLLELMYAVLIAAGFNVLTSKRGTCGLVLLHQAVPKVEVVVLDYQMPVMTGAQLLPAVRELAPAARVLGISDPELAELPPEFREGVDRLLIKPFTRSDLVAAVSALLPLTATPAGRETGQSSIQTAACCSVASTPVIRHR